MTHRGARTHRTLEDAYMALQTAILLEDVLAVERFAESVADRLIHHLDLLEQEMFLDLEQAGGPMERKAAARMRQKAYGAIALEAVRCLEILWPQPWSLQISACELRKLLEQRRGSLLEKIVVTVAPHWRHAGPPPLRLSRPDAIWLGRIYEFGLSADLDAWVLPPSPPSPPGEEA